MPEVDWPPLRVNPAIGPGGRLPRRILVRRYAFALAVLLLLGLGKVAIQQKEISVNEVATSDHVVASGLVIGPDPTDTDLRQLHLGLQVDGVVNLAGPSVAEGVTVASLHQAYLYLALPAAAAPTWAQLRDLAGFVRRYRERGAWVYMHDNDTGGARAVTSAAMLLLLNGQTWAAMSAQMTPAGLGSLDEQQRLALEELSAALHPAGPKGPKGPKGRQPAGNPYTAARLEPW
jgi:hypothetical protein